MEESYLQCGQTFQDVVVGKVRVLSMQLVMLVIGIRRGSRVRSEGGGDGFIRLGKGC